MTAPLRIALATGASMAKPDPETHWLVAALAQQGVAADVLPWDAAMDWTAYPLVVVRTPWDYFQRLPAFLAWAERTSAQTRLVNPLPVLRWNCHKGYLRELAGHGIATVPTRWLAHRPDARADSAPAQGAAASDLGAATAPVDALPGGDAATAAAELLALHAQGWQELVVKPAVSIGAIGALRARADDPACAAHLAALRAEGDVLVQPYLPSLAEQGEVSLIYFGGQFCHAIRKRPAAGDFRVQDMYGGTFAACTPADDEIALATQALAHTPAPTAYARVDLVRLPDGQPAVMELELIEPELFLGAAPQAPERFAQVLKALAMHQNV